MWWSLDPPYPLRPTLTTHWEQPEATFKNGSWSRWMLIAKTCQLIDKTGQKADKKRLLLVTQIDGLLLTSNIKVAWIMTMCQSSATKCNKLLNVTEASWILYLPLFTVRRLAWPPCLLFVLIATDFCQWLCRSARWLCWPLWFALCSYWSTSILAFNSLCRIGLKG